MYTYGIPCTNPFMIIYLLWTMHKHGEQKAVSVAILGGEVTVFHGEKSLWKNHHGKGETDKWLRWYCHVSLSENRVAINQVDSHHFATQMAAICGYKPFSDRSTCRKLSSTVLSTFNGPPTGSLWKTRLLSSLSTIHYKLYHIKYSVSTAWWIVDTSCILNQLWSNKVDRLDQHLRLHPSHPFLDAIFHEKSIHFGDPPFLETPIW